MAIFVFVIFVVGLTGYFLKEDKRCDDCHRVRLSTHNISGNTYSVCADCAMKRNLRK